MNKRLLLSIFLSVSLFPGLAFANDATSSAPPSVTMEESASGAGGRVLGGASAVYNGGVATPFKVVWPYIYHSGVRKCRIDTENLSCAVANPAPSCGAQSYSLSLTGVGYKKTSGTRNMYYQCGALSVVANGNYGWTQ